LKKTDPINRAQRLGSTAAPTAAGFTLVELLVALAMSALVMAAIFRLSMDQQKVHTAQDQVAELQQNIRAALDLLVKDIRMAGYNPTRTAGDGCVTAGAAQFQFRADLNADGDYGDANEDVTLSLITGTGGVQGLRRKITAADDDKTVAAETVIPSVENLEFYYTLADGTRTTTPPTPADVRLVQISLLVRAPLQDDNLENTASYTTPSGAVWGPYNDHYRRRFLSTSVACRNMGLI